jgi:glycosyltransferase involved in cell wall biosynthesis
VRVHIVDPSAYTPPYDHALCSALAALDTEVDLFTSHFAYGSVPAPQAYARHELFYRAAFGAPAGRVRMASKLFQHVPDMLRYRHAAQTADIVHFQWLPVQSVDGHLLPAHRTGDGRRRPLVLTAHDVLPREPRRGQLAAQRRLYDRFDAIIVHSEHGRARLVEELGADGERVHVIPHGVFTHLVPTPGSARAGDAFEAGDASEVREGTVEARGQALKKMGAPRARGGQAFERDRPDETGNSDHPDQSAHCDRLGRHDQPGHHDQPDNADFLNHPDRPVVLMFGLMRPYKGIDVLLDAWRGGQDEAPIEHADLWIAGMPKMDISELRAGALANVRFEPRFIGEEELPAYFQRADLVVLPYLKADQSGVLFTALAFGKPLLLSDVGGFPEIAATGAARVVPAGDPRVLGRALRELLTDRAALAEMCVRARAAAYGRYSWEAIAVAHVELYRSLF